MNKKMKKAAAVIASAVLCLSMSMSVFAAESVTDPDINKPGQEENNIPQSHWGMGTDKDGNKITVYNQKVSEEVEEVLKDEEAVKDILTDAGYKVPENSSVVVLGAGDYKLPEGTDISAGVDFTFPLGVDEQVQDLNDGDIIYVLHQRADGTWEVIEGTVSVNEYGMRSVTANMNSFSPVAFIKVMSDGKVVMMDKDENIIGEVEGNGTAAPTTKTSPKTGE